MLLIFTTFISLIIIGTFSTILINNSKKEPEKTIGYDTMYGNLPLPITPNATISLTMHNTVDLTNINSPIDVFEIDTSNPYFPSLQLAENLAKHLQFENIISDEDFSLYSSTDTYANLEYHKDLGSINISFDPQSASQHEELLDEQKALLNSTEKLKELNIWPYQETYEPTFKYYDLVDNEFYETTEKEEASLVGVNFRQTIDDYPLTSSHSLSGEVEVFINLSAEITKIHYNYRPIKNEASATYPTITGKQALDRINTGLSEYLLQYGGIPSRSLTIQVVIVAYQIQLNDQQYLQPVYIFEGTDNNEQRVTLIVPAIEEEYLIKNP